MRNSLLAVLFLAAAVAAAEDTVLLGRSADNALVEKIRGRLTVLDAKAGGEKDPARRAELHAALVAADRALSAQASDAEVAKAAAVRAVVKGSPVYAVPKPVPKEPAASPRPDPATVPHECADLACKANEGMAKGGLGSLRAGISIYYGDTEGNYPATLAALVPKWVETFPELEVGGHARTKAVRIVTKASGKSAGAYVEDTGGWLYISDPNSPLDGTIVIDCKHADYKGRPFWGF